jgi:hypothetical protein
LPDNITEPPGHAVKRQPGASCLWVTKSYVLFNAPGGLLFELGDPIEVLWFREGRAATRAEVLDSIESGYPILLELAQAEGDRAVRELERLRARVEPLLPQENPVAIATT